MVVAAQELRSVARLVHRRAPELAAPDDQRRVEQAALLQVVEQRGRSAWSICWHSCGSARRCRCRCRRRGVPARGDRAARSARRARPAAARAGSCWRTTTCPARCRTSRASPAIPRRCPSAPARSSACGTPSRTAAMRVAISGSPTRWRAAIVLSASNQVERLAPASGVDARRDSREEHRSPLRRGTPRPGTPSAESRCPSSSCRRPGCSGRTCSTTNAGQVLVVAAQAVGEPRAHAGPAMTWCPVFMKICAGAWLNCVVFIDRMIAMSSAMPLQDAAAARRSRCPTGRAGRNSNGEPEQPRRALDEREPLALRG